MGNDRTSQLEQELRAFETNYEASRVSREKQITEILAALAGLSAEQRGFERSISELRGAIRALDQNRPTAASWWAPAGLVGAVLAFIFGITYAPLHDSVKNLAAADNVIIGIQAENSQHLKDVDARLAAQLVQLHTLDERSVAAIGAIGAVTAAAQATDQRLRDVDSNGTRHH